MQALMRMRFGPYTFLQNPAQLQVENRALQQEERLLSGGVCVTPAGRRATVITGKGWWYGGRALEMAQVLRRLLLPGQAHWLFAPGAGCSTALLLRRTVTRRPGMLLTAAPGCGRGKTPLTLRRAPVCR